MTDLHNLHSEVFLKNDLANILRATLLAGNEAASAEYRRGFVDAVKVIAVALGMGVVAEPNVITIQPKALPHG